jgi:hypothetical protein
VKTHGAAPIMVGKLFISISSRENVAVLGVAPLFLNRALL